MILETASLLKYFYQCYKSLFKETMAAVCYNCISFSLESTRQILDKWRIYWTWRYMWLSTLWQWGYTEFKKLCRQNILVTEGKLVKGRLGTQLCALGGLGIYSPIDLPLATLLYWEIRCPTLEKVLYKISKSIWFQWFQQFVKNKSYGS